MFREIFDRNSYTIDETFSIGKEESSELVIDDEPVEQGKSKTTANLSAKQGNINNTYENTTDDAEEHDEYVEDEMEFEVG